MGNSKSQFTLLRQEPPVTHLGPCKVGGGVLTAVNILQITEECDSSPQKCSRTKASVTVLTEALRGNLCVALGITCVSSHPFKNTVHVSIE